LQTNIPTENNWKNGTQIKAKPIATITTTTNVNNQTSVFENIKELTRQLGLRESGFQREKRNPMKLVQYSAVSSP